MIKHVVPVDEFDCVFGGDFSVARSRGYIIMPVGDKWLSL